MSATRGLLVAVVAAAMFGAACGVLGGIGLVHYVAVHHPDRFRQLVHGMRGGHPPFGPGEGRFGPGGRHFGPPIDRLTRDLNLDDAQRARIEAEVERTRLESHALRESLRVRIERQLTAEQRARFRALAPPDDGPSPGNAPGPRPDEPGPGGEREGRR